VSSDAGEAVADWPSPTEGSARPGVRRARGHPDRSRVRGSGATRRTPATARDGRQVGRQAFTQVSQSASGCGSAHLRERGDRARQRLRRDGIGCGRGRGARGGERGRARAAGRRGVGDERGRGKGEPAEPREAVRVIRSRGGASAAAARDVLRWARRCEGETRGGDGGSSQRGQTSARVCGARCVRAACVCVDRAAWRAAARGKA
jgi:hypothetical protein